MKTIKIMHTADFHLGCEVSYLGEKAAERQSEFLLTYNRVIDTCKAEKVELLIIAGDLFESNSVSNTVTSSVAQGFERIPETIIAVCCGNHDPMTGDSPLETVDLPENVILFGSNMAYREFPDLGLRLYGESFSSTYHDASEPFKEIIADDNYINIAVIHGDIAADTGSRYNPISLSDIENSGMDYIAFGHIHKRSEISVLGGTSYAYSGCPEGRGFDETGEKGGYIGYIGKKYCDLHFIKLCSRTCNACTVDISGSMTDMQSADIIKNFLLDKYKDGTSSNLYKIILTGETEESYIPNNVYIAALLIGSAYFIKIQNRTRIKLNLDELKNQISLKGIFVKKMLERISQSEESERETLERALYMGLRAFEQEVATDDD